MDEPGRKHRSLLHKSFGIVQTHCQNVKWVQELRWFIAVALLWHIQNLSNWTIFSPQRIIYIPSPHLVNRSYPFTLLHCSFIPPEGENTISPQFTTGFEVPTVSPPPKIKWPHFGGLEELGAILQPFAVLAVMWPRSYRGKKCPIAKNEFTCWLQWFT